MKSKVLIIQIPGENCEYERLRAVEPVGLRGEIRRWTEAGGAVTDGPAISRPGGWG